MHILLLRPERTRADGTRVRKPVVRIRGRKYGPVSSETVLSIKRDLAIYGPAQSGKTRWLAKLHEGSAAIWSAGREVLHLRVVDPLGAWAEDPRIAKDCDDRAAQDSALKPWAKLRAFERTAALVGWVDRTRAVLILDDVHLAGGRKADTIRQLIAACSVVVYSATEPQRIPMSLRTLLQRREPQEVDLKSDAAYDATGVFFWFLILLSAAAGAWPVATALGGLKVMSGGRRAAKQS
jgi:hypothetical protein